jgi:sigma-E factor negative regulatory protein RseA
MPAAAAAGFVAVAGVLVVMRLGTPGAPVPAAVMAGASAAGLTAVSSAVRSAEQPPQEPAFIRDPRLDEYLRAHQSARGGVAAASPGGTLRRVDVVAPAGTQK